MSSLTAQYVGVILAIALAVGWIVKRIRRGRGHGSAESCHDCPAAGSCHTCGCSGRRQVNVRKKPSNDRK